MIVINVLVYILYVISLVYMTTIIIGSLILAWQGKMNWKQFVFSVAVLGSLFALIDKVF
ncbi:hypothetical protein [Bacillus phage Anath]|uniref:Uncharacterized protein n=1 Tax=Bacillus phage Anath TaxID=2108114 RepID=A0A2P1JUM6_9CAUD|nr:hypothetical protein [Bacillus phage Anath]